MPPDDCATPPAHRFDPLGLGCNDDVSDLGHSRKSAQRPTDERQPGDFDELFRTTETRTAAGCDDEGTPDHRVIFPQVRAAGVAN